MASNIDSQIEVCINQFKDGSLTEESLLKLKELNVRRSFRQDLLYLTCGTTSPNATVHAMKIVENGVSNDGPAETDDWPYQSLIDAINDGWRVIKFPEQALLLSEEKTYGLGCEYVLERIR
jgi:hypothetical protein